jgi:hypothetical protein
LARIKRFSPLILLHETGSTDVTAELRIGSPPRALAHFNLFHNEIEGTFEPGVIFEVAQALGEDLSPIVEFDGLISVSLKRLAERHYAFELRFVDDLRLVLTAHGSLATVHLDSGTPLTWSLDGRDPKVTTLDAQMAVSHARLEGALDAFQDLFPSVPSETPAQVYAGALRLELSDVTARAHIDSREDVWHVSDLGLGSSGSQLLFNEEVAAKLQLSAPGRHAVQVDIDASEHPLEARFLTNPQFSMLAEFERLAPQIANLPASLLNNVISLELEGATPSAVQFLPGQLRVSQGTLKIGSADMPERSQSVSEGQCLRLTTPEPAEMAEPTASSGPAPAGPVPQEPSPAPTASALSGPDTPFGHVRVGACL